jgi:hypothetical protein
VGELSGAQGLQARRERVAEVQCQALLLSELHSAQQPESRPSQFEAARRRPCRFEAAPVRPCHSSRSLSVCFLLKICANKKNVGDQVIRENPANRGPETSAEVLVGPPWRMVSNAGQQQEERRGDYPEAGINLASTKGRPT